MASHVVKSVLFYVFLINSQNNGEEENSNANALTLDVEGLDGIPKHQEEQYVNAYAQKHTHTPKLNYIIAIRLSHKIRF